jgi:hypothetical protein
LRVGEALESPILPVKRRPQQLAADARSKFPRISDFC